MIARLRTIRDNRGVRRQCVAAPLALSRKPDDQSGAALRDVQKRIDSSNFWPWLIAMLICLGLAIAMVLVIRSGPRTWLTDVTLLALFASMWGVWLAQRAWNRRRGMFIAAAMVRGLCPACGYDLREIDPEEDGCSVCPECAGAWKIKGIDSGVR